MFRLFFLFLILPVHLLAQNLPAHQSSYVNDFAGLLDPETHARVETMLRDLRTGQDVEMTLVTINSRHDYGSSKPIADFATDLFNFWGVGHAERNDGILVLVAHKDREIRVVLGSGYPPMFDDRMEAVIDHHFLPWFRQGEFARGIEAGVTETIKRADLVEGDATRGLQINPPDSHETPEDAELNEQLKTRYEQEYATHRTRQILSWILWAVSGVGGTAGIVALVRYRRNRPRTCPKCSRQMVRLSEEDEDVWLSHGQTVEERLNSKDYDVWHCQHDDHVTISGYRKWFSGYSACAECNFRTLESDRVVLRSATKHSSGRARVDYDCQNCGHSYSRHVTIPRISDSSSSSGGSSSGGSSSGGSFGGGSSSGGGASGSW